MSDMKDPYESYAATYDCESRKYAWYGPHVLFGLMFPCVKTGQKLLDLGIGTGLGSMLFHKAGLIVSGMDSSPAMLAECRRKNLGFCLTEHDLTDIPWPFESGSFDHVVATGVFHFVGDLRGVFAEAARVLRTGGSFGFDIDEYSPDTPADYERFMDGVYTRYDVEYKVKLFRHSIEYVSDQTEIAGFELRHDVEFLVSRERRQYFRSIVLSKRP